MHFRHCVQYFRCWCYTIILVTLFHATPKRTGLWWCYTCHFKCPLRGSCLQHISVWTSQKTGHRCDNTLQLCQAFFTGECGNKKLSSADDSLCVLCWKWPLKKEQTIANYFSCSFKSCIQKIAYNYIMLFVLLKESTIWIVAGKKPIKQYTHNYKVLPSDLQLNQLNQHLQEKQNPLRM